MSHNAQFLSLDIRTSIAELRALNVPESAIELLTTRILKASEDKTNRLQHAIVEIEDNMQARLDAIDAALVADLRTLQASFDARAPLLAEISADIANIKHLWANIVTRWPEVEQLLDERRKAVGDA
jgi:hypothetical protein